jgi:hypothetical protein
MKYTGAEFLVHSNVDPVPAKVIKRSRDNDDNQLARSIQIRYSIHMSMNVSWMMEPFIDRW